MTYSHSVGGTTWRFDDLREVMAKASPARSGDLLAFVQGGGYIIASLSPLAAGLLRDRLSDVSQAWMLMGLGLVAMAAMTLAFKPGGAKLR